MKRASLILLFVAGSSCWMACVGSASFDSCPEGASRECPCDGRTGAGIQACGDDGTWEVCHCMGRDSDPGSDPDSDRDSDTAHENDHALAEVLPFVPNDTSTYDSTYGLVGLQWHQLTVRDENGPLPGSHIMDAGAYERVRHRVLDIAPLTRPPRAGEFQQWFQDDFEADCRYANAIGLNYWAGPNTSYTEWANPRGLRSWTTMIAACEEVAAETAAVGGSRSIRMAPSIDINASNAITDLSSGEAAADAVFDAIRGAHPNCYLQVDKSNSPSLFRASLNGKTNARVHFIWGYNGDGHANAAGLAAFRARLEALYGESVIIILVSNTRIDGYDGADDAIAAMGAESDGVADWARIGYAGDFDAVVTALDGIGGTKARIMSARVDTSRHLVEAGKDARQADPDSVIIWEPRGSLLFRNQAEHAAKNSVMAGGQLTGFQPGNTPRDFMEGQGLFPSTGRQFATYDLAAFYINWFKSGRAPTITRDALYWFHRAQIIDNTNPMIDERSPPIENTIELVGLLTAPGTIQILDEASNVVGETAADAQELASANGIVVATAPAFVGTPRFRLMRDGVDVIDLESDVTIRAASPTEPRALYRAGGSLRRSSPGLLRIDPESDNSALTPDDWLSPTLGEPVPYVGLTSP